MIFLFFCFIAYRNRLFPSKLFHIDTITNGIEFIFLYNKDFRHKQLNKVILNNFIKRALTGAFFVLAIIAGIWFNPIGYWAVFTIITALSQWEFYKLVSHDTDVKFNKLTAVLGGTYLFFATFMYAAQLMDKTIFLPYILFAIYTIVSQLYLKATNPIKGWAYTFLAQIMYVLPFCLLNFISFGKDELGGSFYTPVITLSLFVFIWLNDTGAYLVGSRIGKHRLFERISPKKSWEGFWGGMIFAALGALGFSYFFAEIVWYNWIALSIITVIFGTWGDLAESLLKRTIGVKDSSNLLPGHGGMLDRIDSISLTIPAAYIYILYIIQG